MDSHHTVNWKFMLIYTSISLVPNMSHFVKPWSGPVSARAVLAQLISPLQLLVTPETQCDAPSWPIACRLASALWNSSHVHISSSAIGVEVMNNTSFILLLQEICNTWNRMRYGVYLDAWRTQGASIVSVCAARQGARKEENRGNKLLWLLTVHQLCGAIIVADWGVGCWDLLASLHT